jgi:hypothetical protein
MLTPFHVPVGSVKSPFEKLETLAVWFDGCCDTVITSVGTVRVATFDRTVFQPLFSNFARYFLPESLLVNAVRASDDAVCPLRSE